MAKEKSIYNALYTILIIGMLISLFLLYEHFVPDASKFCTFGTEFDCGIVNKSPYANLDGIFYLLTIDFGIPIPLIDISGLGWFFDLITANAFLGAMVLLFLFFLLKAHEKGKGLLWIRKNRIFGWMRGILVFSVVYGFYLFLIQHYILKTYCIFCLALDAVLIIALVMVWRMRK